MQQREHDNLNLGREGEMENLGNKTCLGGKIGSTW